MKQQEKTAVILARVSTGQQASKGTSIEDQIAACERCAEANTLRIVGVYREDGASGGLYQSRAPLQEALAMIEAGAANILLTGMFDRSGRDMDVLRAIRKRVIDAGGTLMVSNGMEFADTPDGELMFNQLASFASFERSMIRQRTTGGKRQRAKQGKQSCRSFAPFGYHVVSGSDVLTGAYPKDKVGTYQVVRGYEDASGVYVPGPADWAIRVYEQYAGGMAMRQIIKWLKENHVLSPRGLPEWSPTSVRRLLGHPAYKGEAYFGRTKRMVDEARLGTLGGHGQPLTRVDYSVIRAEEEWIKIPCEPLVTEALWDACQDRIKNNKTLHGGNPKRKYLLGGLIACPKCTRRVAGSKQKTHRYYVCPHDRGCKWRINADRCEDEVRRAVLIAAQNPELSEAALRAFKTHQRQNTSGSSTAEVARLRQEVEGLEARERAIVEAQLNAMLKGRNTQPYEEQLDQLNARRREINERLSEHSPTSHVTPPVPYSTEEMIKKAMECAAVAINSPHLHDVEKNEILSKVVECVCPSIDGEEIIVNLRPFA